MTADPPTAGRSRSSRPVRATIQDVAERAGVTKATVSKYLNLASGGYYVAARTRQRIEDAIHELGFEPNMVARGLTSDTTSTIGLVVADIRNPFYPDLVAGVQGVIEPAGYTLVLGSSGPDPAQEQAIVRSMIRRRVDGIILSSSRMEATEVRALVESGTRLTLASRHLEETVSDVVIVDNVAGAELAVDHLAGLGHERIAHLAGPQNVTPFRDRLAGYRGAMTRNGLPIDESLIHTSDSTPEGGAASAARLLAGRDRPTAIFVANDNMALGVLDTARKCGLSIPNDLSVVGFDNIALAANSLIALTTVDSSANAIGADAARLLLESLASGEWPPHRSPQVIVHEPVLHIRGTTAPPRA